MEAWGLDFGLTLLGEPAEAKEVNNGITDNWVVTWLIGVITLSGFPSFS